MMVDLKSDECGLRGAFAYCDFERFMLLKKAVE